MMKTDTQIQVFLSTNSFQSEPDWEMIQIFCKQQNCSTTGIKPKYTPDGINVADFTKWFRDGYGSGDVVLYGNDLCVLGWCGVDKVKIAGVMNNDGFNESRHFVSTSEIIPATKKDTQRFYLSLSRHGLQYHKKILKITEKFKPIKNSRIEFTNGETRGIGIVREINYNTGDMELYCYYLYDTDEVHHSMHETEICNYHSFDFENMTVGQLRRLNRELGKKGKIWNDKLHRIEPTMAKAALGEKYWYINDKLKVIQDKEKGTPTSHFRYIAGNYFLDYDDALDYLTIIQEILRDRLAKTE